MKIKTLFISILAATCLGISACNPKDAPKSSEEPVASSSIEELSSDEPIESSEDPVTSSEEPPHEHAFGEWTQVTAPTCTEKGKEERVCVCGEKEERDVNALGHLPKAEWEQTVAPSVDAEGEEVLKCERCGAVLETRKIDKLEPPAPEFETQVVDFSGTSGSGEHNAESLGTFVLGDLITSVSNISKISVIGYGITNNNNILNKIMNILELNNLEFLDIEITDLKIAIIFKEKINNTILEQFHKQLINN